MRVFNFAAGPSQLPLEVLQKSQQDLLDYNHTGMSVMEMSHRSKVYQEIFHHTKQQFIKVMNIPDTHTVLFMQGGASSQFSCVPLNFLHNQADYAITGNFSNIAYKEALKYGDIHISYNGQDNNYTHIPTQEELNILSNSSYFHYCANNTIYGTEWSYIPDTNGIPIICDMSSNIASKVIDISKYDLIYAGAQKNLAPSGVTIVIIRKSLLDNINNNIPLMFNYKTMYDKDSMYNTPPCWQIYMLGLVMDWLDNNGGLSQMELINKEKSDLLYNTLEQYPLFHLKAEKNSRSRMNVTFTTNNEELDNKFIKQAEEYNLYSLKGHRLTKGIRASIYNAMPLEGVKQLCLYIEQFARENHV